MARKPLTREHVVALLREHHIATGPQLVDWLADEFESVNKTTVYRVLDNLLEDGEVCRQSFSGTTVYYELRSDHHDHVVCESCGLVTTLPCDDHEVREIPGFLIGHHHMTYFGLCNECRERRLV